MGERKFENKINDYFEALKNTLDMINREEVEKAMNVIIDAYERESDIYCFGNGGSASTASHMCNDFNKGVSIDLNKKFRFHCLSDNIATLTAIANDIDYEDVFCSQFQGRLRKGDLIIAISGSGNSTNVIKAVEYAKETGCLVIGITGFDGGELNTMADYHMHVPINNMQIVEDIHLIFNHMMMSLFCELLLQQKEG